MLLAWPSKLGSLTSISRLGSITVCGFCEAELSDTSAPAFGGEVESGVTMHTMEALRSFPAAESMVFSNAAPRAAGVDTLRTAGILIRNHHRPSWFSKASGKLETAFHRASVNHASLGVKEHNMLSSKSVLALSNLDTERLSTLESQLERRTSSGGFGRGAFLRSYQSRTGRKTAVQCSSEPGSTDQSREHSEGKPEGAKRRVVFLGTPEVAAGVLRRLLDEAAKEYSQFEITAVVSQPAAKQGRGRKLLPSPVSALATESGLPEDRLLCPETAREEAFLEKLSSLAPDLCITAAYGNILPNKFLAIPRFGTLNIHPSLLPLYRGASPVQRAIEAGEKVTGVTVAFTVRAMDAGPILAQEEVEVDPNIRAPELLEDLFRRGTELLLRNLPSVFDGSAAERAREQEHGKKTEAPKVQVEEAILDFEQSASKLHNKVRAFAGWPGTKATLYMATEPTVLEPVTVKVITTRVVEGSDADVDGDEVALAAAGLRVKCGDGSVLEIQELQPPSKKPMRGRDFWNGLRGKRLYRTQTPKGLEVNGSV